MEQHERLLDRSQQPTEESVTAFIGAEASVRWSQLLDFIASTYPGVFSGEWLYGGAKHGWSLRFKKSKSFCTLIPERGRMRVLVVFGAAERDKMQDLLPELSAHVRDDFMMGDNRTDSADSRDFGPSRVTSSWAGPSHATGRSGASAVWADEHVAGVRASG